MKNIIKNKAIRRIASIIAIPILIGFAFAACDSPTGPGSRRLPSETAFSVSGSFTKTGAGGGEVQFSLADTASSSRSARAVTEGSYAVSGELVDGDIIFRLSGTYDPVAMSYTASSSSSLIRYSINGAFSDSGASLGSTATLLVRGNSSSDDWTAFSYVIDETAAVLISATEYAEEVTGGIPSFARGWWSYTETYQGTRWDVNALLSEWTITQDLVVTDPQGAKEFDSFSAAVVEVTNHGGYYNVIVGYPVYIANKTHAEAAAVAFMAAQSLTAEYLAEPPGSGLDDWHWYIQEGYNEEEDFHYLTYGFQMPEFLMGDLHGPGVLMLFIFEVEMEIINSGGKINKAQIADAVRGFLAEHGVVAEELDGPKQIYWPEGPKYWYDEERKDIVWADFSQNQWSIIQRWYSTNYLEKYLIGKVSPATKYSKSRITFSHNNTRMTITDYGVRQSDGPHVWYDYECLSVSAAKALTQLDPDSSVTITR